MPDLTVVTPVAVVPADRLTLGATDVRAITDTPTPSAVGPILVFCMAEE